MSEVETRIVQAEESEIRLDRWFKRHFPQVNHGHLEKLLRTGQVRVDGKRAKANVRLETGQSVRVPPLGDLSDDGQTSASKPKVSRRDAAEIQGRVLYRDADVLVIDKPPGLAVQGGTATPKHLDAMLDALQFDADERPKLVHRLDKDTSGVLVLARNTFAAAKLAASFRGKDARKYYWAMTVGVPRPFQGKVDAPLAKEPTGRGERVAVDDEDGKRAVSLYQVIEHANKKAAWVALWPLTGRTHQLRVHMQAIGTPILGDGKYGGPEAFLEGSGVSGKLHLHARRLILPHPRGGRIDVTAPLPDHMAQTWDYFSFDKENDGDPFASYE
ncbi:pseudouridine synthase [Skermanella stibiiresistens SB22]|uniref:Pseudouridine synthase n=1 Tax=Skermanella stibiiresistens SB22 TaxID=1385369 RepID=W9H0Z4_9PROT|nr:RluA family pseudouridine synthase [Skermanella stibiiresistens]EWY39850.1 pseudouridine synthase [Skermanella stibiiresistens SB22]